MTARATLPYGSWPSPISAADVARARLRLSFPTVSGPRVWWQETRPAEGGRTTVMHLAEDGRPVELLPAPWNACTRVHEYGGRSYLPIASESGHSLVFSHADDQRLRLLGPGDAEPRPLTPEPARPAGLRYADYVLSPDETEIWCVCEGHTPDGIRRAIVAVPLDGSAAENPGAIRELVTGPHFFASPTPSPGGGHLAWVQWSHPRMPWDGTEVRVAAIEDGKAVTPRTVKGGLTESALAPVWASDQALYVVSDWPGWWNVYQVGLYGESPQALYPAEEEFADAPWQLGGMPYALLADGRLAVLHGEGDQRLGLYDPDTLDLEDLDLGYDDWAMSLSASGTTVVGIGGGPGIATSLVRVDTATGTAEVLRTELDELPDAAYLPPPREDRLDGTFGRAVHAYVYEPANPAVDGPPDERPPYVVFVHDGPARRASRRLDLARAYFTSRGIGVVDVNYGGSTGHGRTYRERTRRQWGVVDVEDAVSAARALADAGFADPGRLAIRGSGWTALAAATATDVFKAATAYAGVGDPKDLAATTHDFESQYLFGLIGPLPGFERAYDERSPLQRVESNACPILLLHGLDDPVVPAAQSEKFAEALADKKVRHARLTFADESHVFQREETVRAALEAELSFYGQTLGFEPRDVPALDLG
ncbi:alpha/beta hydrolase family protein [Actinomadura rubteroloni]|nr:prolyl oligopeptidase family serine peptidase [Actinomadura rubteroloni]